jgi:Spy/CpxP family protein refolding chaperone
MKKIIALAITLFSLHAGIAQEQGAPVSAAPAGGQPEKPRGTKPEMMASRHSKHLQKMLVLTDEQTQKTYQAMLTRFNEVHAAREKAGPNADRKALREQTKPARQKFVQTMHTILTPEQKAKWEQHRRQMKKNAAMRKDAGGNPPPAAGNGDIKKLTDDDDGIEE